MKKKRIYSNAIIALLLASIFFGFTSQKKRSIDGNWRFVEIQTVKANGTTTSTFPKEGVAIFSNNYYSFCWTSHVANTQSWAMADSVKLDRFNQSIVNTGTYELKGSSLTTKAIFAMNPMFTNGLAKFNCSFIGDTLVLTGLSVVSSNNISHPAYTNGSHFVTKLLRVRK